MELQTSRAGAPPLRGAREGALRFDARDLGRILKTFVGVAILAVALALVQQDSAHDELYEQPKIASHLALGHGFATPLDDGPTAALTSWAPPVYPMLMAAAYLAFGLESDLALFAALLINALSLGALAAATYVLGALLYSRSVGVVCALAVGLHPLYLFRVQVLWDSLLALAMFAWLMVGVLAVRRAGPTPGRLAWIGVATGVLALTNVSYALAAPPMVLLALQGQHPRRVVALSGLALLTCLLTLAPWTARNYLVFGRWMPVRGGTMLEAWLGNRPGSDGWVDLERHPLYHLEERALYLELGETRYWDACADRFLSDYRSDPRAFWMRTLRRLGYAFVGRLHIATTRSTEGIGKLEWPRWLADWALTISAVVGLLLGSRDQKCLPWLVPILLAIVIPFTVTHVSYRYLMPAKFLLLVLSGGWMHHAWKRWGGRDDPGSAFLREPSLSGGRLP